MILDLELGGLNCSFGFTSWFISLSLGKSPYSVPWRLVAREETLFLIFKPQASD